MIAFTTFYTHTVFILYFYGYKIYYTFLVLQIDRPQLRLLRTFIILIFIRLALSFVVEQQRRGLPVSYL